MAKADPGPDYRRLREARDIDGLVCALAHENPRVRIRAVAAAREMGGPEVVGPLMTALTDSHGRVRALALEALAEVQPEAAERVAATALASGDQRLQATAAAVLCSSTEKTIAALRHERASVRQHAFRALWQIADARAVAVYYGEAVSRVAQCAPSEVPRMRDDPQVVEALCEALRAGSTPVRYYAAWALAEIRSPLAAEALRAALSADRERCVRQAAATALGYLAVDQGGQALVQALDSAEPDMRRAAAMGWPPRCEPPQVPLADLIRLADHADPEVRRAVTPALAAHGSPEAIDALRRALGDSSDDVRSAATYAAGRQRVTALSGAICTLLRDDPAGRVRGAAASVLEDVGDSRAVEPLCAALSDGFVPVRRYAARALGALDDTRAVEPLCTALSSDPIAWVRKGCARALGQLRDPRAVEPLIVALRRGQREAPEAAQALGEIGGARALEVLLGLLREPQPRVSRATAAWALGETGDPAVTPFLCVALDSDDECLLWYAAHALGKVGDERAVEPLRRAVERGGKVREAALEALAQVLARCGDPAPEQARGKGTDP